MEKTALRRVNVRAVIYYKGEILAVKHKDGDGNASPHYSTPGGGLEPGESLVAGVRREIIEETGIEPMVGRLLFIQQFRSRRRNYREELEFFYLVENPQDYMAVDLSTTTHGEAEIAVCEFVNPGQVDILPTFLKTIDLDDYVTNVRSPYLFVEL